MQKEDASSGECRTSRDQLLTSRSLGLRLGDRRSPVRPAGRDQVPQITSNDSQYPFISFAKIRTVVTPTRIQLNTATNASFCLVLAFFVLPMRIGQSLESN